MLRAIEVLNVWFHGVCVVVFLCCVVVLVVRVVQVCFVGVGVVWRCCVCCSLLCFCARVFCVFVVCNWCLCCLFLIVYVVNVFVCV